MCNNPCFLFGPFVSFFEILEQGILSSVTEVLSSVQILIMLNNLN